MTKEILNMQSYELSSGFGIPKDGWQQSHIEYNGYNSNYENAKHLTDVSVKPSEVLDCDRTMGIFITSTVYKIIFK